METTGKEHGPGWLGRRYGLLKGYYSILGIKIAVAVGLFMLIPFAGYLILHEYRQEGYKEAYEMLTFPPLWAGMFIVFAALMIVLSKVVILPLKRFEQHISRLEKGAEDGPFVINRRDEIGFLAARFNSLHKFITGEIQAKEAELNVIHTFTESASGTFSVPALMENFFAILRTAVPFDMGAYLLCHKSHADARIFSTFEKLADEEVEGLFKRLLKNGSAHCSREFPKGRLKRLQVERLSAGGCAPKQFDKNLHAGFREIPIICFGEPVGMISLISYRGEESEDPHGRAVFNTMVQHASAIIEKLLTHMFNEEKRLSHILSSMSEGVYLLDREGNAASLNNKGVELLGAYCAFSMDCTKTGGGVARLGNCPRGPEASCEFSHLINKIRKFGPELEGRVYTEEIKNNNGMILHISISGLNTGESMNEGYVITVKDMTEDRLLQKRLMLSSKLTALGEMAAGVAHEVNNPLQVMMANIELLDGNVTEKGSRRLDLIKDGIFRIKNIVRDLLIFAREQTTESEDVDINTLINKSVDMIGHQLKVANVGIELDLDKRALTVKCNRNLFQQVMINLLQNAKDAIEDAGKGTRVSIRTIMLPAGIIVVEVSDDGPGIPEGVIDRIFDPFFTTKDVGKGTGLGLSVSRRIIEGMGGSISVASSARTGTVFTISLLHSRPASRKEFAPKAEEAPDYSCLSGKSVLIVDDEESLVRVLKDSIGPRVSSVESAGDGKTAFDIIMDKDFDFILLDVKMPGMNGMEFYRAVNECKPYLTQRIIFLTGDTESEATSSFIKLTGCKFLAKPCAMKEVLDAMHAYEMEIKQLERT